MWHLGFKMGSDLRLTASKVDMVDCPRCDLAAELEEHLLVPKEAQCKEIQCDLQKELSEWPRPEVLKMMKKKTL